MLLVAVGFGSALVWLMPLIDRTRDRQQGGEAGAGRVFKLPHLVSVLLDFLQMLLLIYASAPSVVG